ncbi:hypothetical protein IQ267_28500, partial [filamentous cyanobacterium LEGE 07170]|nr:hypothetical protein [filamentous cyanobacterium LEGE 07170]
GGDLAGLAGDTTIGLTFAGAPSLTDVAGNAVDVTLPAGADYETFIVENTAPTITGVTSTTADGTYGVGTDIDIEVTFDEVVFVDTTNGTPTLDLNSGGSTIAQYISGDGTDTLVFRYTVVDGEDSLDLDYDGTTSLQLNGGTIRDLATNDATATLVAPGDAGSISDDQDIVVDTTEPTVVSIVRQVPTDAITAEDSLTFRVTFSEEVDPATVEAADFTVNGVTVAVDSATPAGSNAVFDVVVNDAAIANFNGEVGLDVTGDIRDAGNNILNTAEPTTDETFTLDNTVPTITNITSSTPDAIYNEGDVISIQVEFSEAVNVTGTPTLTLDNGATADFDSVSGSTATFTYTVQAGDTDTSDLNVTAVNIAADEIEDVAGNDAATTLPAGSNLANNKELVIDNTVPTLLTVARQAPTLDPIDNPDGRTNADSLTFRVTFSEEMVGVGIDDFAATGTTATVSAVTPVGAAGTVFDVTLSGGDLAGLAGDATIGLTFAGAPSLTDVAGNAVDVTLPTGADYETFIVENTAPTITGVTSTTADGTYGVGTDIAIEVAFD